MINVNAEQSDEESDDEENKSHHTIPEAMQHFDRRPDTSRVNDVGLDVEVSAFQQDQEDQEEEERKGNTGIVEMKPKLNQFKQQRTQHKKDIEMFEEEI